MRNSAFNWVLKRLVCLLGPRKCRRTKHRLKSSKPDLFVLCVETRPNNKRTNTHTRFLLGEHSDSRSLQKTKGSCRSTARLRSPRSDQRLACAASLRRKIYTKAVWACRTHVLVRCGWQVGRFVVRCRRPHQHRILQEARTRSAVSRQRPRLDQREHSRSYPAICCRGSGLFPQSQSSIWMPSCPITSTEGNRSVNRKIQAETHSTI